MQQKIVVIGAGLSGLTTIKELVEAGQDVICFEKGHDIGGVFSEGSSYDSVQLTVSNYFMAYSDFMPYGEPIRFWSRGEYRDYLNRYVDHFKIRPHIKFGYALQQIKKLESGQWELTFQTDDHQSLTTTADKVAICSGQFQKANIPDIPGLQTFPGAIIHSSQYKNAEELKEFHDKRVLCFGMGESAADVITEIASVAASSVLSLRRHHMFAARYADQYPIDVVQSRHWHSLPAIIKSNLIRDTWKRISENTDEASTRLLAQHILAADDEAGSVVTKTERIFEAQAHYGLDIDVGGVKEINGNTVTFNSGRVEEFDAIVFCTGFKFSLPFLEEKYQFHDIRDCYLQVFHPELRDSLAFIGFVRPQQGGIPLMAELQARYFALVCAGDRTLPSNLAELAKQDAERWKQEFYVTPNVFGLVNGLRYNEMVADLIGCRPPVPNPLLAPKPYLHYWFHHVWPCQYRLVGPGARAEAQEQWMQAPSSRSMQDQLQDLKGVMKLKLKGWLSGNQEQYRWRPIFQK